MTIACQFFKQKHFLVEKSSGSTGCERKPNGLPSEACSQQDSSTAYSTPSNSSKIYVDATQPCLGWVRRFASGCLAGFLRADMIY